MVEYDCTIGATPIRRSAQAHFTLETAPATGVSTEPNHTFTSSDFALLPNYPNPVRGQTSFPLQIIDRGFTTLKVYDMLGRQVASLIEEEMPEGVHVVAFDASQLPSGTYLAVLEQNGLARRQFVTVVR